MFGGKFLAFGKSHDPYHHIRHDIDFIRKRLVEGRAITLSDIILNHRPMETPELLATLPDAKQRSRRFRKHEPVFCPYAGWSLAFALESIVCSRVDCVPVSRVSACYKEISPQFALRHLKKKHPEWKDEKSTEMNDKIYLFLLPGRRLRKKSDKEKPKNVSSVPTEPSITNPALTYVPSDPKARVQIVIGASVRTALASIPRATGPWINSFYEYMSTYRKGESIWSEYRTLVQRFLGFARLLRGMELEIKEDSEIDAEVGGLLDKKVFSFSLPSLLSPSSCLSRSHALTGNRGVSRVPHDGRSPRASVQRDRQAPRRHHLCGPLESPSLRDHVRDQGTQDRLRHPGRSDSRCLSSGDQRGSETRSPTSDS